MRGNEAAASEADVPLPLQSALEGHVGKLVDALIRSGAQMAQVLKANPDADRATDLVHVTFLNEPPLIDILAGVSGRADEEIAQGRREL